MPMPLDEFTAEVSEQRNLDTARACEAARLLADPSVEDDSKYAFLAALGEKGESENEVAAFAETFREIAIRPDFGRTPAQAIDVCGTGGDNTGTFNISTVVGFLIAASGVPVIKHGNRSITSQCGSADILEAVGFKLDQDEASMRRSLEELNFVFLFAPNHHPAFKHIAPVRKRLAAEGRRSVFNILGPLVNPAAPAHQLIGVFDPSWCSRMAYALNTLGLKRGMVVHCCLPDGRGMDELTCAGDNVAATAGDLEGMRIDIDLSELGFDRCAFDELVGGDLARNCALLDALLRHEAPQGLSDTVILNAGAGLWVAEKARSFREGVEIARSVLETGQLALWLERVKAFYSQ